MDTISYTILLISIEFSFIYCDNLQNGKSKQFRLGRAAALPLPPPEDSLEESEESRGLRGQSNVLLSIARKRKKCSTEGFYGIRGECKKYKDCQKAGLLPSIGFCQTGKYFDHLLRHCVPATTARCKDVCTKKDQKFPDPMSHHRYLQCFEDMVPIPRTCKDSLVFNPDQKKCVEESSESEEDSSEVVPE